MRQDSPSLFCTRTFGTCTQDLIHRFFFWMGVCTVYFCRIFTFPLFADVQNACNSGTPSVYLADGFTISEWVGTVMAVLYCPCWIAPFSHPTTHAAMDYCSARQGGFSLCLQKHGPNTQNSCIIEWFMTLRNTLWHLINCCCVIPTKLFHKHEINVSDNLLQGYKENYSL
jgi:hypothetical protein